MNKTITSNIAGYVFHIDENAFNKLDAYLNTIRSYFSDSQGKDEIIADIEARLAEMLQERIGTAKEAVTIEDVNHVIGIMGQPESFIEDDPETAGWSDQRSTPRNETNKRLFRDPDNRVVGGVCSGISQYLGINDSIWLRLALVIAAIFFGTGFLLYIILWILIPEATSTAEKLQMRGENVTVSNIEKKVNEELETVKNKWNEFHGNKGAGRKVGNAFHRLITLLISIISMSFNFMSKIIGFAFLMAGIMGFVAILASVFAIPDIIHIDSNGMVASPMITELIAGLFSSPFQLHLFKFSILMTSGIPLLLLAYLGVKMMLRFRTKSRYIVLPMLGLWFVGLIISSTIVLNVKNDYAIRSTRTETVNLQPTSENQVLYLDVHKKDGQQVNGEPFDMMFFNLWVEEGSDTFFGRPMLDITQSSDNRIHLVIERSARGKSKKAANQVAMTVNYDFSQQDSLLLFSPIFNLDGNNGWRGQNIALELQIPEGQTIQLGQDIIDIIYDIKNVNGTYDSDMVNRKWIMRSYGLECVDCAGLEPAKLKTKKKDALQDLEQLEQELQEKQQELKREMEELNKELKREKDKLQQEMDETEEANIPQEILLKRVIQATYQINPTTLKHIRISYPG